MKLKILLHKHIQMYFRTLKNWIYIIIRSAPNLQICLLTLSPESVVGVE